MRSVLNFVLIVSFCIVVNLQAQGYLHTSGKNIVNGQNETVILRGIGLGGWMVQEGYMMQTSSFANAQHELKAKISALVGEQGTKTFYDAWLLSNCRKADIDSLAKWGFNSVRLPMHYNLYTLPMEQEPAQGVNTWLDQGFELTDSLLAWCAANEMYLILDLHAAPGGQGYEAAISDYDDTKPSLWQSAENRSKTVALWRKLAERYANEPWIGGYDLLNETNWDLPGNSLLKQLYVEIKNNIRAVDVNHIIFIEGNWFANDFTGLTPPFDNNMAYSFHKYWSHNKTADIQWVLNIKNQYNVPLWCGESGENSNTWYTDAIKLFEENNIGWSWWPLKKIDSISGLASIDRSGAYQRLLDYWEGRAASPGATAGLTALLEIAENSKIENCLVNSDVIDAMFRQVQSTESIPYKGHSIPGILPVVEFDLGQQGYAYADNSLADYHVSTGDWTAWNNGFVFRNDGVDIQKSEDRDGQAFGVGWIESNEWLKYTVNASLTDSFAVSARIASAASSGLVQLMVNNALATPRISVPQTSGWQVWESLKLGKVRLLKGVNSLKLQFASGGFNINQLEFVGTGTGLDTSGTDIVEQFKLYQNYPNPFNHSTKIEYILPESETASLSIYNMRGQRVRRFFNVSNQNNFYTQIWDGLDDHHRPVASGIYIYSLITKKIQKSRKMVLLR